jgi:pantetheine-phosphate adenylyltransferase
MPPLHALFPGTFDPPTAGHLDVIRRAARIFPRVTVALAEHPTKQALFTAAERIALLERCTEDLDGVFVQRLAGLVVRACEELGCDVIVRGVRCGTDFDYEAQMAGTNRALLPRVDTVLLATAPEFSHVTATLVRQVASMGGDVSALVPGPVAEALRERFGA